MSFDVFLALAGFAFVSSITPGPNNLMLMASGANFGLRRSLPHALGVALGFAFMIVPVGLGLARVFDLVPWTRPALAVVSVTYLLYLAWRIATAAAPGRQAVQTSPMTFLQAAAFQWVNPKAWTMALTAVTLYASGSPGSVMSVALVFGAINLPSVSCWTVIGREMRRLLTSPVRLRVFNWTMAALLVASLWPTVAPLL